MRVSEIGEIANLTTAEKILMVEDLWDSIASDETSVPVPRSHRAELERRLKRYRSNPGKLLSLRELQTGIGKKR